MSTAGHRACARLGISPFTLALYGVLGVTVAAVVLAWLATGRPWYDALGWPLRWVIRFRQAADSWGPMQAAIDVARSSPAGGLYEEVFFRRHIKFQYPPASLLLVWDLTRLQLKAISLALLAVNVAAIWAIVETGMRAHGHPAASAGTLDRVLRGGAVAGLVLMCHPLTVAFALGQIQTWVNAGFALLVLAWMRGRNAAAGGTLGMLTWIKPQYALLALWAARTRAVAFTAGTVVVAAVGLAAAVWRFGAGEHVAYRRVLHHLARHGEAFYANQSINGFLQRAAGNTSVDFDAAGFPPFDPIVYALTVAAFVALAAVALAAPVRLRQNGTAADLAFFTIVMTVTAPIAWEHHYGVIPPALAAAIVPFGQRSRRWEKALLVVSWVLLAALMPPLTNVGDHPWNAIQSYRLFGALLLAALLVGHMWRVYRSDRRSAAL
jgi:alpha-1,2-mannosyltransferase